MTGEDRRQLLRATELVAPFNLDVATACELFAAARRSDRTPSSLRPRSMRRSGTRVPGTGPHRKGGRRLLRNEGGQESLGPPPFGHSFHSGAVCSGAPRKGSFRVSNCGHPAMAGPNSGSLEERPHQRRPGRISPRSSGSFRVVAPSGHHRRNPCRGPGEGNRRERWGTLNSGPRGSRGALKAAEPILAPSLAIALFAGVRSAEVCRLTWRAVDFDQGHIEIGKEGAKDPFPGASLR